jgi:hypothetical protein
MDTDALASPSAADVQQLNEVTTEEAAAGDHNIPSDLGCIDVF